MKSIGWDGSDLSTDFARPVSSGEYSRGLVSRDDPGFAAGIVAGSGAGPADSVGFVGSIRSMISGE